MPQLVVSLSKTLKLANALICRINLDNLSELGLITTKMDNYIQSKGFIPVGPIIQHSFSEIQDGEPCYVGEIIRQVSGFIHNTDQGYKMHSVLRVQNCMYTRFSGAEKDLIIAQQKISVTAYESDITLSDSTYYVYLNSHDSQVVVDIFTERQD